MVLINIHIIYVLPNKLSFFPVIFLGVSENTVPTQPSTFKIYINFYFKLIIQRLQPV